MKQASRAEVKIFAEKLIAPVVEDLRKENRDLYAKLKAAKDLIQCSEGLLKVQTEKARRLQEKLEKEQAEARQRAAKEKQDAFQAVQITQEAAQAVSRDASATAKAGALAAQRASQAREEAVAAKKVAEDARAETIVRHMDDQKVLTQVRAARELAEKSVREEGRRQCELIVQAVRKQEERLQGYAERTNEQANELVEIARRTLQQATDLVEQIRGI